MPLAVVEDHELYAAVGEHPYHRGRVPLPQGAESLAFDDRTCHTRHVAQAESRRRDLIQYLDPVDGGDGGLGEHAGESPGEEVARLPGEGLEIGCRHLRRAGRTIILDRRRRRRRRRRRHSTLLLGTIFFFFFLFFFA